LSTMIRGQFEDLYFERLPLIDHIIFDKYNKYPEEFSKYFNMNSSTRAFENVTGITTMDYLVEKPESTGITYDSMLQAYNSMYTHLTYALGFRVSSEGLQDDLDGILSRGAAALGTSAMYSPEIVSADVFNTAFDAPAESGKGNHDGLSLCNTAHVKRGGGTESNKDTADLSVTALQTMINNFAAQTDHRGKKINIKPRHLVVPQALSWTAQTLLGSDGLPGSADNDINTLKTAGLTWSTWHFLSDPIAWFMLADKSDTELNFFWRQQFTTDHDTDFDTGDGKTKISGRFSVGWSDHKGVFGSDGTA